MILTSHFYSDAGMKDDFCLIQMSDFNSLIAISQDCQTPVFALNSEQIKESGKKSSRVLTTALNSQNQFKDCFSILASKVINLTSNAVCV